MSTRVKTHAGIVSLLLAVVSIACSKEPKPPSSEIEQALTTSLPAFARVSSFSVEAMQNMGTQVEPVWQSRFHATIKVTTATFSSDGSDPGIVFARAVKQAGDTTELFGKSVSTLYAGKWRTQLTLEGQPIQALGQPESAFGPQKLIVRGSTEETQYLAEQSKRQQQAIVAAENEAEQRRRAEKQAREAPENECSTPCAMYVGWSKTMKTGGRPVLIKFAGKKEWLRSTGRGDDNFTLEQFSPGEAQFRSPDGSTVQVQIFPGK